MGKGHILSTTAGGMFLGVCIIKVAAGKKWKKNSLVHPSN
jgi:hypothetical protein